MKKFGVEAQIDLYGCNFKIDNKKHIKEFLKELVLVIDMKAHGEPIIDCFGEGSLYGHSAIQFIETSSIIFHGDAPNERCYINIFSCKDFDSEKALKFCILFFEANHSKMDVSDR